MMLAFPRGKTLLSALGQLCIRALGLRVRNRVLMTPHCPHRDVIVAANLLTTLACLVLKNCSACLILKNISVAKLYPVHQKPSWAQEMLSSGATGVSLGPISQSPSCLSLSASQVFLLSRLETDLACLIISQCTPTL